MNTNQGPHAGNGNSEKSSQHSLPPFSSLMKEIPSSNLDKQAITWEPAADDRSKGFQQSYHIPTLQTGFADITSSLPLEVQQYAAKLRDQRTKSNKPTHDVAYLTQDIGNLNQVVDNLTQNSDRIQACLSCAKNLLDSFVRDVSILRNVSATFPKVSPRSSDLLSAADIYQEGVSLENGATTFSNNSAPSISTAFASHRPEHAPQPSQPHQQSNAHQNLQPVSRLAPPNQPTFYEGVDQSTSGGPTTKRTSKKRSLSISTGSDAEEQLRPTALKRANLNSRAKYWTNGNAESLQQYWTPTQSNCSPHSHTHPNKADIPGGVIVGYSSRASGSVKRSKRTIDSNTLAEHCAFLMVYNVVKEQSWSNIRTAFQRQFPNATRSMGSIRQLYYSTRQDWGLPPISEQTTEGKVNDKKRVKEIVLNMEDVQYLYDLVS